MLAKKWNVNFWYVDNLIRGVHNRYFGNFSNTLPCFVRDVSEKEFIEAIDLILSGFGDDLTDKQQTFVNKLNKLRKLKTMYPMDLDLSFIPTGWKHLKAWVAKLDLHCSWMPAFRCILSQVYLLDYKGMIDNIKTAKVTELLRIPFQQHEQNKNKLSYLMVSGPKYVIRRENNAKSLDLMIKQGYFELQFKFLKDKWKDAIIVRVKPSRKMRKFIGKDVTLKSMVLLPPRSNDVDIQLIFEGETEIFVATDHLKHLKNNIPNINNINNIIVNKVKVIGIDLNREVNTQLLVIL